MKLYKIEDGKLKKFKGGFVVLNNRIYTNPSEEIIRNAGYKEIVRGEMPEFNDELQYPVEVYTEDENNIYVNYKIEDLIFDTDETLEEE